MHQVLQNVDGYCGHCGWQPTGCHCLEHTGLLYDLEKRNSCESGQQDSRNGSNLEAASTVSQDRHRGVADLDAGVKCAQRLIDSFRPKKLQDFVHWLGFDLTENWMG